MVDLILTTFDWVPEVPRGAADDFRQEELHDDRHHYGF